MTQKPVAWAVTACSRMFVGEFAELDAKAEAQRCGGTCVAYALYAAPVVVQQAERGWQAIETAPKDGTVILLLRNKEVSAGAFHPELGKYPWLIIEESKDGTNGLQEGVHGPTHWMPLPEAPKGWV